MSDTIREGDLGWTARHYAVWRALFGAYLFVHFAALVPWAAELWSHDGVLPDGRDSPLLLPLNLFAFHDGPLFTAAVVASAAVASVLLAFGRCDRTAAVFLWYVWASLFGRNPLIANPGLPFVGWLLLAHTLMPPTRCADPGCWRFPPFLWTAAWIVMALGYTYSGYAKLDSPSWLDGTAFMRVLGNPLARDAVWRSWAVGLPDSVLAFATYGALALELLFAPLALFRVVRPWLWLAMLSMHGGLMLLVDFTDLSLGMVMMHLFTANPAWLKRAGEDFATVPLGIASELGESGGGR